MASTVLPFVATFSPFASVALIPYAIVFLAALLLLVHGQTMGCRISQTQSTSYDWRPWNGHCLWFTSGGGYEERRAPSMFVHLVMMWGCLIYVLLYVFSSLSWARKNRAIIKSKHGTCLRLQSSLCFCFMRLWVQQNGNRESKTKRYRKLTI